MPSIEVGSIVEGVVTGITNFGAFVLLPNGETGLVHISEVADTYVKDINEYFHKKDKVKVKVLSVNGDGKIGLSIRRALQEEEKKEVPRKGASRRNSRPTGAGGMSLKTSSPSFLKTATKGSRT